MNKLIPVVLLSLGVVTGAYAQSNGVTMSTDPAKAAAVEKHAQELKASQAAAPAMKTGAKKHAVKHSAKSHTGHKAVKKAATKA